jgi:hypothetical protein
MRLGELAQFGQLNCAAASAFAFVPMFSHVSPRGGARAESADGDAGRDSGAATLSHPLSL